METKHKNILIAGLLAVVLVMAVGYAAFATSLNIEGTANITSTWDVHFNSTINDGDIVAHNGFTNENIDNDASCTSSTATPCGKIEYGSGATPLTASIYANLKQPGDIITFKLNIINAGTISATSGKPSLSGSGFDIPATAENATVQTATLNHIKFTVNNPVNATLATQNSTTTMTITAEFIDDPDHCTGYTGDTAPTTQEACETASGTWVTGVTGNMAAENPGPLTIALSYSQTS